MSVKNIKFGDGTLDWRDVHQQVEAEWQKDAEAIKRSIAEQLEKSIEREEARRRMEQLNPIDSFKYRRFNPSLGWTMEQYNEK